MSDALTITQPKEVLVIDTQVKPHHIVWLHRLARMGKADRYAMTLAACQFNITEDLADKWDALKDIERVTLLYRRQA